MGVEDIFDQSKADLTGMYVSGPPLFVSKVKQKVFIDVNEEGTEAAAVTGKWPRFLAHLEHEIGEGYFIRVSFINHCIQFLDKRFSEP